MKAATLSSCWFFVAVFSDFLDGWLARKLDWASELGKILDPLRDKFLILVLAIVFSWFLLFAVLFELISLRFSLPLRKKKGEHVIARGSKIATATQFIAGLSLFLTFYVRDASYFSFLFYSLIVLICACSFFRMMIYKHYYAQL